jgi:hypothetical protein
MEFPAGWTCAQTELSFERYLRSTLVLTEALAIAEHLEACEGCAHQIILYRLTITSHNRE